MDKRIVEQRIEEDRERHKRQREEIWQVHEEREFEQLWREGGEVGEDEWVGAEEDAEERMLAGEV